LRNNAYTNVMVAWIAHIADTVLCLLPESRRKALRERIGLSDEELDKLQEMSTKMFLPLLENGIISQFEGYEELEELDWDAYRERYPNIQRLDRILKAEGDDPDRYKLTKQADAVLLFFLFSDRELARLFERLGYNYGPDTAARTVEYCDQRTSHGSTLSFIAHAGVLAAIDPDSSWERFLTALESDIGDIQGGTTREGIHMDVMSGTLDLCSADTPARPSGTRCCSSSPGCSTGFTAWPSRCGFAACRSRSVWTETRSRSSPTRRARATRCGSA
jgi:trehalose/maltose hydrolase-like predicted phosphorylase